MKKTTLTDIVAQLGQAAVAKALGVSPPAITKALKAERVIFVTEHPDGSLTAEEIRAFPHQPSQERAA